MISMKITAAEAKQEAKEYAGDASTQPEYPYGLTLSIDDDTMKKLGQAAPPAIGSVVMVQARAIVCNTSQYATQSETESSYCLQITDMDLAQSQDTAAIAKSFYGG